MQIHFHETSAIFCLTEEDIEEAFEADVESFLDTVRTDLSPCIDLFLGIHDAITEFHTETGAVKLFPMIQDEEFFVCAVLSELTDHQGRVATCANKGGAWATMDTKDLALLTEECGVKIAPRYYDDETFDPEDLELKEFNQDEPDAIEAMEDDFGDEEGIMVPSIITSEVVTNWAFTVDPDARYVTSVRDKVMAMMQKPHVCTPDGHDTDKVAQIQEVKKQPKAENPTSAPKSKQGPALAVPPSEQSTEPKKGKKTYKHIAHYRFANMDAAITAMADERMKFHAFPNELRIFNNKGLKEYHLTVRYEGTKEEAADASLELMEFAQIEKMPRGDLVSPVNPPD